MARTITVRTLNMTTFSPVTMYPYVWYYVAGFGRGGLIEYLAKTGWGNTIARLNAIEVLSPNPPGYGYEITIEEDDSYTVTNYERIPEWA